MCTWIAFPICISMCESWTILRGTHRLEDGPIEFPSNSIVVFVYKSSLFPTWVYFVRLSVFCVKILRKVLTSFNVFNFRWTVSYYLPWAHELHLFPFANLGQSFVQHILSQFVIPGFAPRALYRTPSGVSWMYPRAAFRGLPIASVAEGVLHVLSPETSSNFARFVGCVSPDSFVLGCVLRVKIW